MGSDNPLNYGLKAANVRVLQVDGAWLGQAKTAVKLSGGTSTDKITFRLVCIQGMENTLHSRDSNATIASLGGWYRISEPNISSNTRLVSALFEPRSWVSTNSKTALAVTRNSISPTEDMGEDDSYVPSNDELLNVLANSFVSIFGVAPSVAEKMQLQGIINSGFTPDEFAAALQDASALIKLQIAARWKRAPSNAELAKFTMAWLFSENGIDLNAPVTPIPANCNFQNLNILHGDSVMAYANSRVPFGDSCRSERRTCNNGSLSGSLSHTFCNVDAPANCRFVSGITVAHGKSVLAYKTVKAVHGQCVAERRSCSNGSLSGSFGHSFCK